MLARLSRSPLMRRSPMRVSFAIAAIAAIACAGAFGRDSLAEDAATAPIPPAATAAATPDATAPPAETAAGTPDATTSSAESATAEPAQPEAPPPINPALKAKLDGSGAVVVEGQRTHAALLRRFYAARNYDTVWDKHSAQALLTAAGRAEEHGLDPSLFHVGFLQQHGASLDPIDRELLTSDAILGFADALARGAVPVEERPRTEALNPEPLDIPAVVDKALDDLNPAQAIGALAPQSPEYAALQRAYLAARTPTTQTVRGGRITARGNPVQQRELAVALERLRWLPRHMPGSYLWVNTEDAHLDFYRDGQKAFSTRVVVGEDDKQTPEFETHTPSVLFNPPWYVPRSIFVKEIMPKLAYNPGYLAQHHMSWHAGTVRQDAGPYSALGRIKFEMEDPFDVYLHDTPSKGLFASADRRRSHGCVRVQNPFELASLLLSEPLSEIERKVGVGYSHRQGLAKPVPVFVVYQTVGIDRYGRVEFRPDYYGRDALIWSLLNRPAENAIEQVAFDNRPRG